MRRMRWKPSEGSFPSNGQIPTQDSWTAARISPCERTVRNRFASFRAAVEVAD